MATEREAAEKIGRLFTWHKELTESLAQKKPLSVEYISDLLEKTQKLQMLLPDNPATSTSIIENKKNLLFDVKIGEDYKKTIHTTLKLLEKMIATLNNMIDDIDALLLKEITTEEFLLGKLEKKTTTSIATQFNELALTLDNIINTTVNFLHDYPAFEKTVSEVAIILTNPEFEDDDDKTAAIDVFFSRQKAEKTVDKAVQAHTTATACTRSLLHAIQETKSQINTPDMTPDQAKKIIQTLGDLLANNKINTLSESLTQLQNQKQLTLHNKLNLKNLSLLDKWEGNSSWARFIDSTKNETLSSTGFFSNKSQSKKVSTPREAIQYFIANPLPTKDSEKKAYCNALAKLMNEIEETLKDVKHTLTISQSPEPTHHKRPR